MVKVDFSGGQKITKNSCLKFPKDTYSPYLGSKSNRELIDMGMAEPLEGTGDPCEPDPEPEEDNSGGRRSPDDESRLEGE